MANLLAPTAFRMRGQPLGTQPTSSLSVLSRALEHGGGKCFPRIGGNCPITTCIGPHISINAAKNGLPNGITFVATTPSHWNTPCFNTSQPTRMPTAWAQNLDHRLAQQRTWVGLHQRHQHSNMHANRLANSNGRGHIPTKPCHTTLAQARATRAQPPRPHR